MTEQSIAEVAARLTKASRRALVKIADAGWTEEGTPGPARTDAYSLWWGKDGGKGLTDKPISFAFGSGLIASWKWRLTPLGRQVRNHLISQGADHDR